MDYMIGIDIGTSGTKSVLLDSAGTIAAVGHSAYDFDMPRPGWAEQEPEVWWQAAKITIGRILQESGVNAQQIKAVGFSGQMHGPVFLNAQGQSIRPAIIWADQRSAEECRRIYEILGKEGLYQTVCNPVDSGFMAATMLWLKHHEPDSYQQIDRLLLPKDYVKFRLTGKLVTDPSDAGGTSLYDVRSLAWSDAMLTKLGISPALLPVVRPATDIIGIVSAPAASETGLAAGTPVINGGNDQTMGALAAGVIAEGPVLVMLGTGGTVFTTVNSPLVDPELRMHTYPHCLTDRWHLLGAILSGGFSLKWFRNILGTALSYEEMTAEAATTPPGAEGLIFLPYLAGERTPHMNSFATGVFFGLTVRHTRAHLIRAVMEGVGCAIRDCLELFAELGVQPRNIIMGGGGAHSELWRQIHADILNLPVLPVHTPESSATGAAMLAGIGIGIFPSVREACARTVQLGQEMRPRNEYRETCERLYQRYRALYPALQEHFPAS